jgi:hypothetical protein
VGNNRCIFAATFNAMLIGTACDKYGQILELSPFDFGLSSLRGSGLPAQHGDGECILE